MVRKPGSTMICFWRVLRAERVLAGAHRVRNILVAQNTFLVHPPLSILPCPSSQPPTDRLPGLSELQIFPEPGDAVTGCRRSSWADRNRAHDRAEGVARVLLLAEVVQIAPSR